jgi:hypothetical protein
LKNRITEVLTSIEIETELFVKILCWYPSKITVKLAANEKHTDYWLNRLFPFIKTNILIY